MRLRRAAAALGAAVALAACGVKAPPRPPIREATGAVPADAPAPEPEASSCDAGCTPDPTPTPTPTPTSTSTSTSTSKKTSP